jgi:uncharacterized protein
MKIEKVEQAACECMVGRQESKDREPGWLYHHGRRVARIALRLADEIGAAVDRDVMYAGALFHDVGKGAEPHNEIGATITRETLKELCTPSELEAIGDVIRNHNQRQLSDQFCDAVKIVQDADVLDHVGSIGPWLAFYWSGVHNETFDEHVHFIEGEENATTQARMKAGLNYEVSRRLFEDRLAFENRFFAEVRRVYLEGI